MIKQSDTHSRDNEGYPKPLYHRWYHHIFSLTHYDRPDMKPNRITKLTHLYQSLFIDFGLPRQTFR